MYDIVEGIHKAFRIDATWQFVLLIALGAALVGGFFAYVIDVGYKNSREYREEHPDIVGVTSNADKRVGQPPLLPGNGGVFGVTLRDNRDHAKMFMADMKLLDGRPIPNGTTAFGDRWKGLFDVVMPYQDSHGNNLPTVKWVNKKLKQQRKDFRISMIRRATEADIGVAIDMSHSRNFNAVDVTAEGFDRVIKTPRIARERTYKI